MHLVTHQNNPQAVGDFDPATETITLLPGAILSIDPVNQRVFDNIKASYAAALKAREDGHISLNGDHKLEVRRAIPGLSPARAHVFATGRRGNGWILWRLENGEPIDVYRHEEPRAAPPNLHQQEARAASEAQVDEEPDDDREEPLEPERQPATPQLIPSVPDAWDGNLPEEVDEDCLSIYRIPTLPHYLQTNRPRILELGAQQLPPWDAAFDDERKYPQDVMRRLRWAFPDRRISRSALVALFESWDDPVLCLVATMVWGAIDTGTRADNLSALLLSGEESLRNRMEALSPLIRAGDIERAFVECSPGRPLKLSGVDYPYFTKLFYFMGQVRPVLQPAPLILDKWTSNAFLVLGRQVCPSERWQRWFRTEPLCSGKAAAWDSRPSAHKYCLYVAWFNHWARQLGTSASQLEQFVFGWDRRRKGDGKAWWNPRNELIALGKTLFCPPPAA